MANFFADQLDYIFFCYGLAFIVLGVVAFAIGKGRAKAEAWAWLGIFGWLHGLSEWLDLLAMSCGDGAGFAALRVTALTASFFALAEFARRQALGFGRKPPPPWLYLPLAAIIIAGGIHGGPNMASALARYLIAFAAAEATALAFLANGLRFAGPPRRRALLLALGFSLYGVAAGLIVPAASFWPANLINQSRFAEATGLPIQLIRALLAIGVTYLILRISLRMQTREIASPRYTEAARRDSRRALTAVAIVLVLGWRLTNFLGDEAKLGLLRMSQGGIDTMVDHVRGETGYVDRIARVLAGACAQATTASPATLAAGDTLQHLLALGADAAAAERGFILDRTGTTLAAVPSGASMRPPVAGAISGFVRDPVSGRSRYYASAPIRDAAGRLLGTAVLGKSAAAIMSGLAQVPADYYLVDPAGNIIATNRPATLYQPVGSLVPGRPAPGGAATTDGRVVTLPGPRLHSFYQYSGAQGWMVVTAVMADHIAEDRLFGIVVTLMMLSVIPAYVFVHERRVRDGILGERRQALQTLARELETQARTDRLTGLSNRLRFDQDLSAKIAHAERYRAGFSLILYDVDHFKAVNDTYGHQIGDRVLVALARTVTAQIRETDLLARWGGEEFVLLLPDTDGRNACATAEKLRAAVERTEIDTVGGVRCSFGVAEYGAGDTAETILARADQALYKAKRKGRNRVEFVRMPTGLERSKGA